MLRQIKTFLLRVAVNSLVLWGCSIIGLISYGNKLQYLLIAASILSLLNAIIKPFLVIFTLPAIILTLGLFTVFINGFIVVLASWLFDKFQVSSFWTAMLVGLLVGLLNYTVTLLMGRVGKQNG